MRVARCALVLASLLTLPRDAAAVVGHYSPGVANLRDFFIPPSGLYYAQYNYFYVANTFRDRNGNVVDTVTIRGRTIDLDTQINLYAISPMFIWAPGWEFLGARYAAYVALSIANPSLQSAINLVERGRRFEFDAGAWGLGDTFVQPVWLQWSFPRVDLTAGYGFYAPTGRFELGANDNVGLGFWTHQLQSAVAFHFDEAKTLSLIGVQSWEINAPFQDQDLTPGTRLNLNWGISKIWLDGMLETAALAYDIWQLTDDRGSDVSPIVAGVKDQVHGAGVQIGVPKYGMQVKYMREFGAVQRFQGNVVTFTFALPLDPLFQRLSALVE